MPLLQGDRTGRNVSPTAAEGCQRIRASAGEATLWEVRPPALSYDHATLGCGQRRTCGNQLNRDAKLPGAPDLRCGFQSTEG